MDLTNNRVSIVGQIVDHFEYSHEIYGEKFYTNHVKVNRLSSAYDLIPIMISERAINLKLYCSGEFVKIEGQFRSFNKHEEERSRLILYAFADKLEVLDFNYNENYIELKGCICKTPVYRVTPRGMEVADVLLAVNRPYGKSDYIPLIVWNRNARYASELPIGTKISIEGRIQSREYCRQGEDEVRIAYEVSVGKIEEWEE